MRRVRSRRTSVRVAGLSSDTPPFRPRAGRFSESGVGARFAIPHTTPAALHDAEDQKEDLPAHNDAHGDQDQAQGRRVAPQSQEAREEGRDLEEQCVC